MGEFDFATNGFSEELNNIYNVLYFIDISSVPGMFDEDDEYVEAAHDFMFAKVDLAEVMDSVDRGKYFDVSNLKVTLEKVVTTLSKMKGALNSFEIDMAIESGLSVLKIIRNYSEKAS